jgi:hypothetical protein
MVAFVCAAMHARRHSLIAASSAAESFSLKCRLWRTSVLGSIKRAAHETARDQTLGSSGASLHLGQVRQRVLLRAAGRQRRHRRPGRGTPPRWHLQRQPRGANRLHARHRACLAPGGRRNDVLILFSVRLGVNPGAERRPTTFQTVPKVPVAVRSG